MSATNVGMTATVQRVDAPSSGVIRVAEPSAQEWDAFVRQHPDSTGYHLWGWTHLLGKALGHHCHHVAVADGERLVGVLPLLEVRSFLFGRALSSLPYVSYGGVLAQTPAARLALLGEARSLASQRNIQFVVLRHRRRVFDNLPVRTHKVSMRLELKDSAEAAWNALDRKVRNQIRKAEKSALAMVSGGHELLDEFYGIFARNMRDLGTPVYGRALFREILNWFPGDAKLHLARLDGRAVAGALSYAYQSTMEVPSAASLKEYRALCPNHLVYWSVIKQAIAEGRAIFDFGRSTPNDGTYHFKEQWGARPELLHWEYALSPGATLPTDDRHNERYRGRIEAWKRLPVSLATLIGPRIARSVP